MCKIFVETNQLEDPRQQWHEEQEQMLKDYLHRGALDLEVRNFKEIGSYSKLGSLFLLIYIPMLML